MEYPAFSRRSDHFPGPSFPPQNTDQGDRENQTPPSPSNLVLLTSCSTTTTFTDTWKDPEAGKLDFKKVLTLVITDEDIIQRSAETRLAENITRAEAIPAHSFLTRDELKDVEKAKAKVVARGFDGVVLLRIVAVDEEEQDVSGRYISDPSYNSWGNTGFWGYYGYYQPRMYEPGYTISRQMITIEAKINTTADSYQLPGRQWKHGSGGWSPHREWPGVYPLDSQFPIM